MNNLRKEKSLTKRKRMLAIRFAGILAILLILVLGMHSSQAEGSIFRSINLLNSDKQLTTPYTSQNQFGGSKYSSVAFDFHIFAEEATLTCHTNGNIATNILHANYQAFGATQANHLGKREDNYIGKSAEKITNINSTGNIVLGKNIKTKIESAKDRVTIGESSNILDNATSSRIYKETATSSAYIDISKELNKLCRISQDFSSKETTPDVILSKPSGEQQSLTVTKSGGNHYLNVAAKDISAGGNKRILRITVPADTTLIVNVDMKNADIHSLANLVVTLNGYQNGEQIISEYCGLLWNLYDSSNKNRLFVTSPYANVGTSDYFFGTILAPSANIRYGALNGSVIAKKTYQDGKESHRFDFTGYDEPEDTTTETTTSESTTETTTESTTEITTSETTTETSSEENTTETTTEVTTSEATTETTTEVTTSEATTETSSEEATTETTTEVTTSEATTETSSEETTTETTTEVTTSEATAETSSEETTTETTTEITTSETTTEITTSETTTEVTSSEKTTEASSSETTTETTTEVSSTEQSSSESTTFQNTTEQPGNKNTTATTATKDSTNTIRKKDNSRTETSNKKAEKTIDKTAKTGDSFLPVLCILGVILAIGLFLTLCVYLLCKKASCIKESSSDHTSDEVMKDGESGNEKT